MSAERVDESSRPRLRLEDEHGHRAILQPSLLRPGHLALVTPPGQKALFLSDDDVLAVAQFLNDYLS